MLCLPVPSTWLRKLLSPLVTNPRRSNASVARFADPTPRYASPANSSFTFLYISRFSGKVDLITSSTGVPLAISLATSTTGAVDNLAPVRNALSKISAGSGDPGGVVCPNSILCNGSLDMIRWPPARSLMSLLYRSC